jgi:hypothetical protein
VCSNKPDSRCASSLLTQGVLQGKGSYDRKTCTGTSMSCCPISIYTSKYTSKTVFRRCSWKKFPTVIWQRVYPNPNPKKHHSPRLSQAMHLRAPMPASRVTDHNHGGATTINLLRHRAFGQQNRCVFVGRTLSLART